ncbi:MAG TPA: hypothetical protein VIH59_09395 [Candidatus Tectomicrobia bacterium]
MPATAVRGVGSGIVRYSCGAQVASRPQRVPGTTRQAAVQALAYQWLCLCYLCWPERTPYEAAVSLQALKRLGAC